jgi:diguanylate cyclase (GGDEF)-like protein/PAS domain S-box-containing protein
MVIPLQISRELLAQAVDQSSDGITIADAHEQGLPLIYVNVGFEKLTGYSGAELLGGNCSFLQGTDTDQPEIGLLRASLLRGENCLVTLRNYRKDGSMFWNELSISTIRNAEGMLTHFVGIQKDVTARIMLDHHLRQSNQNLHTLNQQLYTLAHTDPLVGISNRRHFDEQLASMLQAAQRTHSLLTVLVANLDQFKKFNERYGRAAGDACLRMVGERIARSFARGSDCVARYDGNEFSIVSMGDSIESMQLHIKKMRDQVRALNIPHRDSPDGILTICVGGVTQVPQHAATPKTMLQQAIIALQQAKHSGHDCEHLC